jgi:hypothetical protein
MTVEGQERYYRPIRQQPARTSNTWRVTACSKAVVPCRSESRRPAADFQPAISAFRECCVGAGRMVHAINLRLIGEPTNLRWRMLRCGVQRGTAGYSGVLSGKWELRQSVGVCLREVLAQQYERDATGGRSARDENGGGAYAQGTHEDTSARQG